MTRDELASLVGKGLTFLRLLPLPDASIDDGDKLQIAGFYRGIAAFLPTPPMPACVVLTNAATMPVAMSHVATMWTRMSNTLVTTVMMESEPCG